MEECMDRKLAVVVCVALTLAGCAAQQPHLTCKAPDVAPDAQRADAPAAPAAHGPEHPILERCRKIARTVTAPIWTPVLIFALARSGGFGC
jgi:hypothetical protein